MTLLQAIILGVVEGITEFLPISSTGHLILASRLLGLAQTDFLKSFEIAIQLGAIASVVLLYWRRFLEPNVLTRVLVAFIPTGIIGFALYRVIKTYLFDSDTVVLWALGLGGVVLIVFELLHRERDDAVDDVASISYSKALLIGDLSEPLSRTRCVESRSNDSRRTYSRAYSYHDCSVLIPARGSDHARGHGLRPPQECFLLCT